jgi:hypothetical protein
MALMTGPTIWDMEAMEMTEDLEDLHHSLVWASSR